MSLVELNHKLTRINKVVPINDLLEDDITDRAIVDYYTQSHVWYRIFHSTEGSVHMALNFDGIFNKEGYYGQADIVEQHLRGMQPQRVLELASGQGFNVRYLAQYYPDVHFLGIDLTPKHMRAAAAATRNTSNLNLHLGNFQNLPFASQQFDLVFVVESFCHANDMHQALTEVFRVLRPGGQFIVFDGFRCAGFYDLNPQIQLASMLVERAMAIQQGWILDDWLHLARTIGFEVTEVHDLSEAIMPNLVRFSRMAKKYFQYPWFSRTVVGRLAPALIRNTVPSYLMPLTFRAGAHSYQQIVLIRR